MLTQIIVDGFNWSAEAVNQQGQVIDSWSQHNLIPDEGISFLMRAPFGDASPTANFYCGLFKGSYIPTKASKAADIPSIGEYVNYVEAERPLWDKSFNSNTYSNTANKAVFTFTEDQSINGFFLVSSEIKGSANGVLLSIVRFNSPKQITTGIELKVMANLSYISGTTI